MDITSMVFIFSILLMINVGLIYLMLKYKSNTVIFRCSMIGIVFINVLCLFALYACSK